MSGKLYIFENSTNKTEKNILINRLNMLNGKIAHSWLNLSVESSKINSKRHLGAMLHWDAIRLLRWGPGFESWQGNQTYDWDEGAEMATQIDRFVTFVSLRLILSNLVAYIKWRSLFKKYSIFVLICLKIWQQIIG